MTQTLFIPGPLPGMNEIIDAKARSSMTVGRGGKRWDAYSDMKRAVGAKVMMLARASGFKKITTPAVFLFEVREPNKRRDPDNFCSGAEKMIFDALQEAGLLENDGWKQVKAISRTWSVSKLAPGVLLTVLED
jgi:Holliday junction resolvase RusA-like endonuclease